MSNIKNINIKNYRGLKNLELKDFKDINLFIGENNTGKTSILEVLNNLSEPSNLGSFIKTSRIRETDYNFTSGAYPLTNHLKIYLTKKINQKKYLLRLKLEIKKNP
jgi:AAA15 family ATPase/GTPase